MGKCPALPVGRAWLGQLGTFTFRLMMTFPPCFSRPHLGSVPDFRFPAADGPEDSYSSSAVLRRPQKGRLAALRDEPSKARASSHWALCSVRREEALISLWFETVCEQRH